MRRYRFLTQRDIFEALNRLRDAFLAAKDGSEVDEIISALLTAEEKLQLGRRILVAECLKENLTILEICNLLKVGKGTVQSVARQIEKQPRGFELIEERSKKVEKEYKKKQYGEVGDSKLVFKKKVYTGIRRKDIER